MSIRRFVGDSLLLMLLLGFSCGRGRKDAIDRPPVSLRLTSIGENRDATWSPDGSKIAFASNREGPYDIYVMEVPKDTVFTPEDVERTTVNLTHDSAFDTYPIWSPDGRWIAYLSTAQGRTDIWVVSPDGKEIKPVTQDGKPKDGMVSWSPDGSRLAFAMIEEEDYNLWVVDLSTGAERRLISDPAKDWLPAWSPDGSKIAFVSDRAGNGDIWVLEIASGVVRRVVDWPSNELSPCWSLDGRWIAFCAWVKDNWDIWIVPASGGKAVQVTRTAESEFVPRWSPDGRWLAVCRASEKELWLVSLPDGGMHRITLPQDILSIWDRSLLWGSGGKQMIFGGIRSGDRREMIGTIDLSTGTITQVLLMSVGNLSLSSDGSKIAFTSSHSGNVDIWTISSSGGRPRQVTIDRAQDWGPAWSPDGTEIVFSSDREGSFDLWAIPSTGGNRRRITSGEKGAYGVSWSPDGRWIAFIASGEIRKVAAEGGGSLQVISVQNGFPHSTAWSKDSRILRYCTRDSDGRTSLWEIPASGGRPSRLMRFPKELGWTAAYALSPEERTFAAVSPPLVDIWMVKVPRLAE